MNRLHLFWTARPVLTHQLCLALLLLLLLMC